MPWTPLERTHDKQSRYQVLITGLKHQCLRGNTKEGHCYKRGLAGRSPFQFLSATQMIKWNLVKLTDDTKIGGVVNKESSLLLQADGNCLDGWLQASNMHFKITECCAIQVIHWGSETRLCLGPQGLRKGFRATEDKCLYKSSHSSGIAEKSSAVFGCVRGGYLVEITNYLVSTVLDANFHL